MCNKILSTAKAWLKGRLAYLSSFPVLLKWLLIAAGIGILVGAVGAAFAHVLSLVNRLRGQFPLIALGLPVGGLVIVFL